jgi:hypothetical protein
MWKEAPDSAVQRRTDPGKAFASSVSRNGEGFPDCFEGIPVIVAVHLRLSVQLLTAASSSVACMKARIERPDVRKEAEVELLEVAFQMDMLERCTLAVTVPLSCLREGKEVSSSVSLDQLLDRAAFGFVLFSSSPAITSQGILQDVKPTFINAVLCKDVRAGLRSSCNTSHIDIYNHPLQRSHESDAINDSTRIQLISKHTKHT